MEKHIDTNGSNILEGQADRALDGEDEGDFRIENAKQTAINLEKNDRSLAEFNRWYAKGRIIVDPEWQRRYVWDRKRASRLIESFLIDLPIPIIYLAINDEGKYEVIDGLQRLTSVFDFFNNEYALAGLEIRPELNGKKFSDFDHELQAKLEDKTLRTFELAQTTPKDLMFLIFERLNTGGVALNDMEIRNCLYRGKLNDLIKELAQTSDFIATANQKGLERRMDDRALVLRFLAFYQMTYTKARKGLKAFFNEFFNTYRNPHPDKIKEFREVFKKSMRACHTVFGDKGFRLRRNAEGGGGEWTPRVNATIFQIIAVSFTNYDIGTLVRSADAINEAYIDLISTDETWVDAVSSSTGDFVKIEYSFGKWIERLKRAISGTVGNDPRRLFSRALKEEIFKQSDVCELCGQTIALLNDAALDHDVQYWAGGKTVPDNARLVHRHCNATRSRSA